MSKMLSYLKIMITRPRHQSKKLALSIQAYDGITFFFPTIEIKPSYNKKTLLKKFEKIDYFDLIIFMSPNAVAQSAQYINHFWCCWPKKTQIIAIGPGTKYMLSTYGLIAHYSPLKNFNTDGLLTLFPLLAPKEKKILICQGENSGSQLFSTLKTRGAKVKTINVYKRKCPFVNKNDIPKQTEIDVIICTSCTGLKNLVYLLHPHWHDALLSKQLLVISPRIANLVKELGFVKPPLISDNASNESIIKTLKGYVKEIKIEH